MIGGARVRIDVSAQARRRIEAPQILLTQLTQALEVIRQHDPARIVPLGGECAVSVAPFAVLARRYGQDLAIVWIDSHPDIGTPASQYPGFHAMAVAALTGHGDPDVQGLLPAIVSADRVALVGLHAWADDDIANVARWGIRSFNPGRPTGNDPARRGLAGWDRLLAGRHLFRRRHHRQQRARARARRRAGRADQHPGAAHRRRPRRRHRCRPAHGGRVHPPPGHAPAAAPDRFPLLGASTFT